MMRCSTLTFDTLSYVRKLKAAGIDDAKAEALTVATAEAFAFLLETRDIVTKEDIRALEMRLYKFIVRATVVTISSMSALQTMFHFKFF